MKLLNLALLVFILFSANTYSALDESVTINSSVYKSLLYKKLKNHVNIKVVEFEQYIGKPAVKWNEKEWTSFADKIFYENQLLLAKLNSENKTFNNKNRKKLKTLYSNIKKEIKRIYRSMVTMGRNSGVEALATYIIASAGSYIVAGVAGASGAVATASLFTVFPFGSALTAVVVAFQGIKDRIIKKRSFNGNGEYNYYKEFTRIEKNLKKILSINKKTLLVKIDQRIFIINKTNFFKRVKSIFKKNKKILNIKTLEKSLKLNGLYHSPYSTVLKTKRMNELEKVVKVINSLYLNENKEDLKFLLNDFISIKRDQLDSLGEHRMSLVWLKESAEIKNIEDLYQYLDQMPYGENFFSNIYSFYDFLVPSLAKSARGLKFKKFKCIKSLKWKYIAKTYNNINSNLQKENRKLLNNFVKNVQNCVL